MINYSVRPEIPEKADKELNKYPELLRKLLFYRGIETAEQAENFLNPVFEENHDPFLMHGMKEAVKRVHDAVKNNEKIVIFSDYDSDGIPGAVVLHDFFKKIGYNNFENYIPHRILEGFGLNHEAIDKFAENGVKLIITIDCGTANIEEAKRIRKYGIDLIIIDHHLPNIDASGKEELPQALAVLNHKQKSCTYPEKNLCASGITFKFVQGFLKKHGEEFGVKPEWEKWLLDMVAIATVADMVPLIGENRIFAHYGLMVLRKTPRPGLQKLFSILKMDQRHITEDDIGFMISPRINAASRMGVPEDAFKMLTEKDEAEADTYARHLNAINDERKGVVASMVKEIRSHWMAFDPEKKRKVLVAGNPEWKPSLLGLVANTLMDDHDGPVFLWGREEGKTLKGSVRSDGRVNIVEMMREASDVFDEYGGHAASGGFTVKFEKIDVLADALELSYEKLSIKGEAKGELVADAALSIDSVNAKLADEVGRLAPFGMENPKPIFVFPNAEIHEVKMFGKKTEHLKIDFKKNNGSIISAIAFFTKPENFSARIEKGEKINLLGNLEKSFFRGRPEVRLRIVDII
jgi:single-stranded-DNA-specific exonuclease